MVRKPSRAVAEAKAPADIEEEDPIRKRWRQLEWFATPPFASRAGAHLIKAIDPEAFSVWEPCCGDGIMAAVLEETFTVEASDIEPQASSFQHSRAFRCDFLMQPFYPIMPPDWIITNPPFELAADFVRVGMERATKGVAILQRLTFIESEGRFSLHFGADPGLTYLCPFIERVPMQLGPWNPKCSTATAYAWFIYQKGRPGPAIVKPIPPGTRANLSRADDVRRFCATSIGALL